MRPWKVPPLLKYGSMFLSMPPRILVRESEILDYSPKTIAVNERVLVESPFWPLSYERKIWLRMHADQCLLPKLENRA